MIYVSIDIETTGLNPKLHGVTEFAAVVGGRPGIAFESFYRWIDPENYVWSKYCLKLHREWLDKVLERTSGKEWQQLDQPWIEPNLISVGAEFMKWMGTLGLKPPFIATGKNIGSFDLQFLMNGGFPPVFRHRALEWVPFFTQESDQVPPDLLTCKQRAGIMTPVAHNALEDALDVAHLVAHGYRRAFALSSQQGSDYLAAR